jgi:hypothetical protein
VREDGREGNRNGSQVPRERVDFHCSQQKKARSFTELSLVKMRRSMADTVGIIRRRFLSGFDQSFANGPATKVHTVRGSHDPHDAIFVAFDGFFGDGKGFCDFGNSTAFGNLQQDVPLSIRQLLHMTAGNTAELTITHQLNSGRKVFGQYRLATGNLGELFADSSHGIFAGQQATDAIIHDQIQLSIGQAVAKNRYASFAESDGQFGEQISQ